MNNINSGFFNPQSGRDATSRLIRCSPREATWGVVVLWPIPSPVEVFSEARISCAPSPWSRRRSTTQTS